MPSANQESDNSLFKVLGMTHPRIDDPSSTAGTPLMALAENASGF